MSTSRSRVRRRRAGARTAVAVAALFILGGLLAPSASAHSPLESSSPEAGEALTAAPEQIELTFGAEIRSDGASVLLVDEQGIEWAAGPAEVISAVVVTAPVPDDLPEGRYEIRWDVISFDGAAMTGVVRFTLGDAGTVPVLDMVVTSAGAAWTRAVAFGVVGALLVVIAHGLVTVYGTRSPVRLV